MMTDRSDQFKLFKIIFKNGASYTR